MTLRDAIMATSKPGGPSPWTQALTKIGPRFLPFADAASADLPLGRILRLALFQVSVGMATALLVGTLNRVMIVELGMAAWLVALMVALPLVFAPFRALIGFNSDTHRSVLGWRRVPYLWMGTLLQFGGLAIMPFALIVLTGHGHGPAWVGHLGAAAAFLLVGAGLHTTQTAGLALATDLAPKSSRPRVVALLYVMLLLGMVASSFAFGLLLSDFNEFRLIQVIQGAALVTMVLNLIALWKQEPRNPACTAPQATTPDFFRTWMEFVQQDGAVRFLWTVGLGTAAFNMQDIILEPYGGEVLHLAVGATSVLTAMMAGGALVAFAVAARVLARGQDPLRLAAYGVLMGLPSFACVILAAPVESPMLFRTGVVLIGFGGGLFAVSTLTAAMSLDRRAGDQSGGGRNGLALGAWGAVQASAAGLAIALGGALRDGVTGLAMAGSLGQVMQAQGIAVGYGFVYHLELGLLFATLIAIGPLVRYSRGRSDTSASSPRFELAQFPG